MIKYLLFLLWLAPINLVAQNSTNITNTPSKSNPKLDEVNRQDRAVLFGASAILLPGEVFFGISYLLNRANIAKSVIANRALTFGMFTGTLASVPAAVLQTVYSAFVLGFHLFQSWPIAKNAAIVTISGSSLIALTGLGMLFFHGGATNHPELVDRTGIISTIIAAIVINTGAVMNIAGYYIE